MKRNSIATIFLILFSTSLFAQRLTYVFIKEDFAGKEIEFKYPQSMYWEYRCGRYYFLMLKEKLLAKNPSLVAKIERVDILFRPQENIGLDLNEKEKVLTLRFNLAKGEDMAAYCSFSQVEGEINSFENPSVEDDPDQNVDPINNPDIDQNEEVKIVPKYDSSWTFAKAKNFISKKEFDINELDVISRKQWGASPPVEAMDFMDDSQVDGIVLHNTEYRKGDKVKKIQDGHFKRKFADIGYHYVIAKYKGKWKVHAARSSNRVGAHVGKGKNEWKIGISIQGDYNPKGKNDHVNGFSAGAAEYKRQPEPAAIEVLGQLLTYLERRYGKLPLVYGHGQGLYAANPGHTDCPGVGMLHIVESFRKKFR